MIIEGIFAAIYVAYTLVLIWSAGRLRQFLVQTPIIDSEIALHHYKALVRTQMYLALGVLGLLVPAVLLSMIVVVRYGLNGLAIVLIANAWIFVLARYQKKWEVRARTLPVASETLEQAYQRVSEAWIKKPLPNF